MKSRLIKCQTKLITKDIVLPDGTEGAIAVDIRYDDRCNNGHNSFSITGTLYSSRTSRNDRHSIVCGCIHKEIEKYLPELSHLIKWHMFDSTGPMYYIANTIYHAKDREDMTLPVGAPTAHSTFLKFDGIPLTFLEQTNDFWAYLDKTENFENVSVEAVRYDGVDTHDVKNNYSLTGFLGKDETRQWYKTPFNSLRQACEFLECLQTHSFSYIQVPTRFNEVCVPNLEYARDSAVWPDAALEQLQDIEQLNARLPELLMEFRAVVESLDFIF